MIHSDTTTLSAHSALINMCGAEGYLVYRDICLRPIHHKRNSRGKKSYKQMDTQALVSWPEL